MPTLLTTGLITAKSRNKKNIIYHFTKKVPEFATVSISCMMYKKQLPIQSNNRQLPIVQNNNPLTLYTACITSQRYPSITTTSISHKAVTITDTSNYKATDTNYTTTYKTNFLRKHAEKRFKKLKRVSTS